MRGWGRSWDDVYEVCILLWLSDAATSTRNPLSGASLTSIPAEYLAAGVDVHGAGMNGPRADGPLIEQIEGLPVIHCYGHSGAGVSLSWGCAGVIRSLVRNRT